MARERSPSSARPYSANHGVRDLDGSASSPACPDEVIALYERLIELVTACGPFSYAVSKTAITLKSSRRGFVGAAPKAKWLDGYFDLQREVRDRRISRVTPYTKRLFVHQYRVTSRDQLDEQFAGWLREAYAVGAGEHLAVRRDG